MCGRDVKTDAIGPGIEEVYEVEKAAGRWKKREEKARLRNANLIYKESKLWTNVPLAAAEDPG
jgi:hypothetical protein